MEDNVVIVGAGHAGWQLASSLRDHGYQGEVYLIDRESKLPYQKPPLSKAYLKSEILEQQVYFRPEDFYVRRNIKLTLGVEVLHCDRTTRMLSLSNGKKLKYRSLVLATGASPRKLRCAIVDDSKMWNLRNLDDASKLKQLSTCESKRIGIIGCGFIGMELSGILADWGHDVKIYEADSIALRRAISPIMGNFLVSQLKTKGVAVRLPIEVREISDSKSGRLDICLGKREREEVDFLIVSIGVTPNSQLANQAALDVDNGIIVNEYLQTSDHNVYAIGDCARFKDVLGGANIRLESIQNANDQARYVAKRITKPGSEEAYSRVPWFWSEQGVNRLQIAGLSEPGDRSICVGDINSGCFSVIRLREDTLTAVESMNSPRDHIDARNVIGKKLEIKNMEYTNAIGKLSECFI